MRACPTPEARRLDRRRRQLALGAACAPLAALAGCGGGGTGMAQGPTMGSVAPATPLTSAGALQPLPLLPLLPLDDGRLEASGTRVFALQAQRGSTQFRAGTAAPTLGYNGALLGPALRLRTGEATRIQVQNLLGETTTVHWHGLVVPADADGGPHQPIAPAGRWEAGFTVANPPSTCWFHPHGHGSTGRQVVAGLAGLLVVVDPQGDASALPQAWGIDDLALVLQDKRFTAGGEIDYALSATDRLAGYAGDTLLVNGVAGAVWQAPAQWVRLRLLNGCNARTLSLRLGQGLPMLQVANEGGWLAVPVARASIDLAPGERAEALVDLGTAAAGQDLPLLARDAGGGMAGMGMMMMTGGASDAGEVTALTLRVTLPRRADALAHPPRRLDTAAPVVAPPGAATRGFLLDGGMMGAPFTVNGRRFDPARVDFAVPANRVEVWQFTNLTGMAHPMHVHGVRMSLLQRDGVAPPPHEQGLRDTVVVAPMQSVRLAVQTPTMASPTPLMLHCHILEHEDDGMMAQFTTV